MWLTENAKRRRRQGVGTTENTTAPAGRRRGRAAIALPARYAVLEDYAAALRTAPLSDQTRRTYTSKHLQGPPVPGLASRQSDGRANGAEAGMTHNRVEPAWM
jgi:hypothetical protein